MKRTISLLVQNEFGALTRIASLFSGRGYNIESLNVAPTLDGSVSRMTIVSEADNDRVEQIVKQLNKLIHVAKVRDVTSVDAINRVFALIKVNLGKRNRKKLIQLIGAFKAEIIDADDKCSVIEAVLQEGSLKEFLKILEPYGIVEFVSSGNIAIHRGKKIM